MSKSNVKKAYVELVSFLEENKDKKVNSILSEVIEMCQAKTAGGAASAFHKNEKGEVDFIRCGYFNLWMPVGLVPWGTKEGSASGYNPMCKEGANMFSQKQRENKSAREQLLNQVAAGEVPAADIHKNLEKLEAERLARPAFSMPKLAFETLEEALAADPAKLAKIAESYAPSEETEAG